jgi:hypothetical protein
VQKSSFLNKLNNHKLKLNIMKNVIKSTILGAYLAMSLSACAQVEPSPSIIPEYATCCGAEPVEITVDTVYKLYVPNSFTPNGDGVNDIFVPNYTGDIRNMQVMLDIKRRDKLF